MFLSLRIQNADHFNNAVQNYWMFALSFICFVVAGILNFIKKYHGLAFIMVYITNGIRFYGYGISKLPYLLYPYIKVSDSGVNASMGLALVIVFILGLLLLVPSLILLLDYLYSIKNMLKEKIIIIIKGAEIINIYVH